MSYKTWIVAICIGICMFVVSGLTATSGTAEHGLPSVSSDVATTGALEAASDVAISGSAVGEVPSSSACTADGAQKDREIESCWCCAKIGDPGCCKACMPEEELARE